jgi:TIGR03009 family protein
MPFFARRLLVAFPIGLLLASPAAAQQATLGNQITPGAQPAPQPFGAPQQAVPQQATAPVQPPAGFELNQLQQAALDAVLNAWQQESAKVSTFRCSFERWEYDVAFGPKDTNIPLNKNAGELSYRKPDKGSFQITEINTFQAEAVPAGQQPPAQIKGNWVKQPNAVGEHWVCDGTSIFEYRTDQKQLVERPLPPQMRGQAIVDGPLPFLFGAEADKLKQRYWMKIEDAAVPNAEEIWLIAKPKFQEQAADFSTVRVIFDRTRLLPKYMQVQMPNGNRHTYIFRLNDATVNGAFDRIQALFDRPRVPSGWKHVVENVPVAQAVESAEQAPR